MTPLVAYVLLFVAVGAGFIFVHLVAGKLIRPSKPVPEKRTIYECGEPTIGSAWIQFDLRFYVVALLFVIFDVEVAFFFPWAEVFGKANALAAVGKVDDLATMNEVGRLALQLTPPFAESGQRHTYERLANMTPEEFSALVEQDQAARGKPVHADTELDLRRRELNDAKAEASSLGWLAFWEIATFFGVLLVGFAYLWRRGDLAWVRSVSAERQVPGVSPAPIETSGGVLVGSGTRP